MSSCAYTGLARSNSTASGLANWTLILSYLLTSRHKPRMTGRLLVFMPCTCSSDTLRLLRNLSGG